VVSLVVNCAETLGLAVAAGVTGAVALRAQTAANAADVAVQVFLLIGVLSSVRLPDQSHPLGYGRERFFWSLLAALGILLGGGVLGLDEALHAALHPSALHSYPVAYAVLVTTVVLDVFALEIGLRPVREQAARHGSSLLDQLGRSTDPAATTVVVAGGCSVIGGIMATAGLVLSELTRNPAPDTVASALIGCCCCSPRCSCSKRTGIFFPGGAFRRPCSARCPSSSPNSPGWSPSRICSPSWSGHRA